MTSSFFQLLKLIQSPNRPWSSFLVEININRHSTQMHSQNYFSQSVPNGSPKIWYLVLSINSLTASGQSFISYASNRNHIYERIARVTLYSGLRYWKLARKYNWVSSSLACQCFLYHTLILVRWFIILGRAWASNECIADLMSWHTSHG